MIIVITYVWLGEAKTNYGHSCMFPFYYNGKWHHECTMEDDDAKWCARPSAEDWLAQDWDAEDWENWDYCVKDC